MDVEQHCTGSVGDVGHVGLTASETPDQPRVDIAEAELALLCALACTGNIVEDPFDLRAAEVSVDEQTGLLANHVDQTLSLQLVTELSRAAVLPNDSVVDGLFCVNIPYDGGLTLVGDTDAGNVEAVDVDRRDCFCNCRSLRRPDLIGVVLHPSRFREVLFELLLSDCLNLTIVVENDCTRTRSSLVKCKNVLFHNCRF